MTNNKDNNFHAGHRERLRTRYLENGISSMADHEILEFLLFHTIPRVDTKNKAYELIKHFGGLSNVLCASVDALMEAGLTRNSAAHIKFVADLNKLVNHRECCSKKKLGYDEMGECLVNELRGESSEKVIAVLLDSADGIIDIVTVSEGSFTTAELSLRKFSEECFARKAAKIVFAHNHPSGNISPSVSDCVTTGNLVSFFSKIGIEVVEHYVIAGNEYVGIKRMEEMARLAGTQR